MAEVKEKETFVNPYVIQMDKFADSLMHLSKTFLTLEDYKGTFTKDEIEEMFLKITDKVCESGAWERTGSIPIRCCMRFYAPWKNMERN